MSTVPINGNDYSDDGSTERTMPNGGFRTWLLPMLSDLMTVIGSLLVGTWTVAQSYHTPSTGDTITTTSGLAVLIIKPSATLAALNIVLPPSPSEGQMFELNTTQAITAISVTGAAGETVYGGSQLLAANGGMSWRYRAADTSWYRRF
jgi:hypothetical protein